MHTCIATTYTRYPTIACPIPAHYWQDGKNNAKCYNQANTNMVILLYRSNYADNLPLFSFKSLQAKLATWFLQHCPPAKLNKTSLTDTNIPIDYCQEAYATPYPRSWRFWAVNEHEDMQIQLLCRPLKFFLIRR